MLYFVLRDGAELWRRVLRHFPPDRAPAVDRAGRRAWKVLDGYIRGTALIAAIDATLIGIGIWLLGVPLALPLAVLVFLGGLIPSWATISGLVAVLVAFADEGGRSPWSPSRSSSSPARRGQLPPAHHPEPTSIRTPPSSCLRSPPCSLFGILAPTSPSRSPRWFSRRSRPRRRARLSGERRFGIDGPRPQNRGARARRDAAAKLRRTGKPQGEGSPSGSASRTRRHPMRFLSAVCIGIRRRDLRTNNVSRLPFGICGGRRALHGEGHGEVLSPVPVAVWIVLSG